MAIIHLVPSLPAGSSSLPGSASRRIGIETGRLISLPYLALHHEEFTWPHLLPDTPVGSYSTVSPITAGEPAAGLFSVALVVIPTDRDARTLSGSLPYGVRTFLPNRG